jgi:hypothetical protein
MSVQTVKISEVKSNPNNPRLIKNDKFEKLVQSLKDFPEMAKVRPIVVNQDFVVLGGNMRLKAMKEAGWKEVPIEVVDWSEDKQREFIIKDNVGFGEWESDILANEWDADDLEKWGLDVPNWSAGSDLNGMNEDDLDLNEEFDPKGLAKDLHKIVFIFDNETGSKDWIEKNFPGIDLKKCNGIYQINLSSTYGI